MASDDNEKGKKFGAAHLWYLVFNLVSVTLVICILAGCRSPSNAQFALFKINGTKLANATSPICTNCSFDAVPEQYSFGISGLCRTFPDGTNCARKFPYSFDLQAAAAADLALTDNNTTINGTISVPPPPPASKTVASVLAAFLAFSAASGLLTFFTSFFVKVHNTIFLSVMGLEILVLTACVALHFALGAVALKAAGVSARWVGNGTVGVGGWFTIGALVAKVVAKPFPLEKPLRVVGV